jgi:hypothetical protein
MNRTASPLRDRELVEMLADEPELLAIADAFVETQQDQRPRSAKGRRWKPVLVAAVVTAALAGAGVGIAAGFGVFHSASPQYSVHQVEQAFADQGIQLQDVSPAGYQGQLTLLDGRPAHAVYVYVEVGKFSGALSPPFLNAAVTHEGNVEVLWLPDEEAAVHAALQELDQQP